MAGNPHLWERYDLEVFCQHCGQYLTTPVGVERKDLAVERAQMYQEVESHATAVDRTVEVIRYVTLQRAVMVEPRKES